MVALRKRKKRTAKKRPEKLWYAIYVILNHVTNEKYLGFTRCPTKDYVAALGKRFDFHVKRAITHDDTLICQNIRKYGKDKFQIVFLEHVQGKQNALDREKELIKTGDYVLNMIHTAAPRKITYRTVLRRLGLPTHQIAVHPGVLIAEEYLPQYDVTVEQFADYLKFSVEQLNNFLKGNCGLGITQAIALSKLFGTTIKFWLNLQEAYDLSVAIHKINMDDFKDIPKLKAKEQG
jgi:addiction module HigA family antidote